ncbi:c-type cytochrome [Jannaschia sp. S6380]|uniref:c-type cytochrome n=1 Tax=Jannaschia sp. S6380 TaxID=2926408 RepID=UPI001FF1B987|nr:c-type cytochrome [Jannaschia sp. S6380]MCK0166490.1 c-type cytochrome [Jannaschia sp. S6380]
MTAIIVLGLGAPALAADGVAGEALYQDVCRNCHGPKAQGMASFPKLSDKDADYVAMRLEQYRAGETVGPNTALMAPHAQDLTDVEIADLASYVTTAFD